MGVYLQPIVQGSNCHCEFNLFYDPQDAGESDLVKELSDQIRIVRENFSYGLLSYANTVQKARPAWDISSGSLPPGLDSPCLEAYNTGWKVSIYF